MTLEIRPIRAEEDAEFRRVLSIVFGNYSGAAPEADPSNLPPDWTLCAFEDGVLATSYAAYPFVLRLNGQKAQAAGVTAVGTLPQFRRRGHLRAIMEHDFRRRYEERREPLAILTASIASIYHRYGYAVCTTRQRYTIEPRWIRVAPSLARPRGAWREGTRDELPLLQRMYRDYTAPRNGYLHRAPIVWDMQVFGTSGPGGRPNPEGPSLIAIYEEDGEPQGYMTYAAREFQVHHDGAGWGQRVFVRDLIALRPSAYIAAWEYLSRFDLPVRIHGFTGPDEPLFDVLTDPRELHATRGDWILGRVIDVERALPMRRYSAEGRLTFEVRDEMCPWNRDRWMLETGPEGCAVSRTKEAPQLTLDISALAPLLYGQFSPTEAVRYGRAEAAPRAPLRLWDDVWRTDYAPHCPDGF